MSAYLINSHQLLYDARSKWTRENFHRNGSSCFSCSFSDEFKDTSTRSSLTIFERSGMNCCTGQYLFFWVISSGQLAPREAISLCTDSLYFPDFLFSEFNLVRKSWVKLVSYSKMVISRSRATFSTFGSGILKNIAEDNQSRLLTNNVRCMVVQRAPEQQQEQHRSSITCYFT